MGKDSFHGPLEQVNETCWRIPKSYKPGMRVDGLIFADEKLLPQIKNDQAPDQVANVAFLPGIQYASLAMPDIHWGYGFCIGGVCATDPDEGGVISPGGVGYDINCLTGDSLVLHAHGYTRRIGDMAAAWRQAELRCFQLKEGRPDSTTACRWFGQRPREQVLRVVTEAGDEVCATADHPFWTPDGMVPLGRLRPGERVAVAPFQGVPYEAPSDEVLLSEADFAAKWAALEKRNGGHGLEQSADFLKSRGLLPLRYSSPALPYLCKLLGFVFGDGSIHFDGGDGKGVVNFTGKAADLETIRADVQQLGVTPSRVYSRERSHAIRTAYAEYEFDRTEEWFKVVGSGFAVLLACLGAPVGKKPALDYSVPAWLEAAPLWQKRLFLAALFGAELTAPATITDHDTLFGAPTLSMNKRPAHVASGREFLGRLSDWLADFGVETQSLLTEPAQENVDGVRPERLRLVLSGKAESLLNLWGRIGYEYNGERAGLAALAVQYLKHKQLHLAARESAAAKILALRGEGASRKEIIRQVAAVVNQRFVERVLYSGREITPRVAGDFFSFADYCASAGDGLGLGGMVGSASPGSPSRRRSADCSASACAG